MQHCEELCCPGNTNCYHTQDVIIRNGFACRMDVLFFHSVECYIQICQLISHSMIITFSPPGCSDSDQFYSLYLTGYNYGKLSR